ncbi:hypothetical protein [Pleomorphovibrio marinus]|uniref:hypothetical protein n=1 Tax=Pleomorphovibrio marinus TaxID=2164132 RepID=UPI000E0B3EF2|nr:hypothetical protein [Pleomorphovibrio marinus]
MQQKGKKFIASVDEDMKGQMQEIATQLRKKGCKILDVLSFSGIITGESSGQEKNLDELRVKGIKHIEEDGEVNAMD